MEWQAPHLKMYAPARMCPRASFTTTSPIVTISCARSREPQRDDVAVGGQAELFEQLDTIAEAASTERTALVTLQQIRSAKGGCPIGSLAGQLAEQDEGARLELADGLDRWETAIRQGVERMAARGELHPDADPAGLAQNTPRSRPRRPATNPSSPRSPNQLQTALNGAINAILAARTVTVKTSHPPRRPITASNDARVRARHVSRWPHWCALAASDAGAGHDRTQGANRSSRRPCSAERDKAQHVRRRCTREHYETRTLPDRRPRALSGVRRRSALAVMAAAASAVVVGCGSNSNGQCEGNRRVPAPSRGASVRPPPPSPCARTSQYSMDLPLLASTTSPSR